MASIRTAHTPARSAPPWAGETTSVGKQRGPWLRVVAVALLGTALGCGSTPAERQAAPQSDAAIMLRFSDGGLWPDGNGSDAGSKARLSDGTAGEPRQIAEADATPRGRADGGTSTPPVDARVAKQDAGGPDASTAKDTEIVNACTPIPLKRYWNESLGDHMLLAGDFSEAEDLGWVLQKVEACACSGPGQGLAALHRYWNGEISDHIYTIGDFTTAAAQGYEYKGDDGYIYSSPQQGTLPLRRYWDGTIRDHLHTVGSVASSYTYKAITGYVLPASACR